MKTKFLLGFLLIFILTACSAAVQGVKVQKGGKTYELQKGSFGVGKKEPAVPDPKP